MAERNRPQAFILAVLLCLLSTGCAGDRPNHRTKPTTRKKVTQPTRHSPTKGRKEPQDSRRARLWVGDREVSLEVALDSASRGVGLSRRKTLASDEGMIFAYSDARVRGFWMKNTWVALDIAFVGDDLVVKKIVSLEPPAPNCSDADMPRARSDVPARYVVEMNKGWFARHGLGVGSRLRFSDDLLELVRGARN